MDDALIFYTLDGTTPTIASTKYTGPIHITQSSNLKVVSVKKGYTYSDVTSVIYRDNVSWDKPIGTTKNAKYVTSITTTNASKNIVYQATEAPQELVVLLNDNIAFKKSETFSMNVKTTEGLKWTHAIVYVDWNRDFDFDDEGEQIYREGIDAGSPQDVDNDLHLKGNESVKDFSFVVQAPEYVSPQRTLMRIQFNDAWHKMNEPNHSHSAMDEIDKGRVYDIYLDILPIKQSLEDELSINKLKVYPTKIDSTVTIETPHRSTVRVYNINGYLVCSFDVDGRKNINCSSWDKGELFLRIENRTIKLIH